jgi:hypothetical protein
MSLAKIGTAGDFNLPPGYGKVGNLNINKKSNERQDNFGSRGRSLKHQTGNPGL